jgi:hypothetical protein
MRTDDKISKGQVTGRSGATAPVAAVRRSGSHGLDLQMTNDYIVVVEDRIHTHPNR